MLNASSVSLEKTPNSKTRASEKAIREPFGWCNRRTLVINHSFIHFNATFSRFQVPAAHKRRGLVRLVRFPASFLTFVCLCNTFRRLVYEDLMAWLLLRFFSLAFKVGQGHGVLRFGILFGKRNTAEKGPFSSVILSRRLFLSGESRPGSALGTLCNRW